MSLLAWIVLGFLTALVASKTINKTSELRALDLLIGIAGGIFGGYAFRALSAPGPVAFSILGLFVAVAGAAAFLAMYRAIFRPE
jgi:uncharacterized membrane protein YeaQ/YmgE (transglycosylase-associated protein family)